MDEIVSSTTPTPDNAASATPVAYLTGDWRAKPCVTRADFGGDDALMHATAKEMRWVPLVPAATVAALEAECVRIERENREGWKQAAHHRQRADAADRRVAALEAEVREQSGWADKWKALHDAVSLAHEVQAKSLVRATERAEAAEKVLDRVVRWCDGVMNHPMIGWNPELYETAKNVKALTGARAK